MTRSAIRLRTSASSTAMPSSSDALAQDGQARGEVGRADVGDQAGLEALAQAVLERVEVARRAVGGQDDLARRRRAAR